MIERYVRLMDALYLACVWLAGASLVVMTVIIPWGVYARYVLGSGSRWPEPTAVLLMIVFTFFGAAATYRANGHICMSVVTDRVPPALQRGAAALSQALLALLCVFMVVWGIGLCRTTWGQTISDFPWLSVGLTYLPVPVSGLITLLFLAERALAGPQHERAIVSHEPEERQPAAQEPAWTR